MKYSKEEIEKEAEADWKIESVRIPMYEGDAIKPHYIKGFIQGALWMQELSKQKIGSTEIIGNVQEHFKHLSDYNFDWKSFYNGWIEGRSQLIYGEELSKQEVSGQIPDECLQQQSCDYPVGSCKKCTPKAAKQEPQQGWTDVIDGLPECLSQHGNNYGSGYLLGYTQYNEVEITQLWDIKQENGTYKKHWEVDDGEADVYFTHWMPLPKSPLLKPKQ